MTKPGKYEIPCAELCGFGHSGMRGWLYVHTPDEYDDVGQRENMAESAPAGRSRRRAGVEPARRRPREERQAMSATARPRTRTPRTSTTSWASSASTSSRPTTRSSAIQFLFSALICSCIGGLLALVVRWQLAWPDDGRSRSSASWSRSEMLGGQMPPEFYNMLFTMHATIMIFFVIIPILTGAFGNFLIPLMIGARDMAFPKLNMMSLLVHVAGVHHAGQLLRRRAARAAAGWTVLPAARRRCRLHRRRTGPDPLAASACSFVGISSMMGSVNYITTIINMRAPGMTMFRMPMTIWALFITAILQAVRAAGADRRRWSCSSSTGRSARLLPARGLVVNGPPDAGGGQPLLWQHLFWFYPHPAVYIMILPAMGMVSDIICRLRPQAAVRLPPMVYSIAGIAGLGFIVWGHHMFQ